MATNNIIFNIIEGEYNLPFPYEEIKEDYYNSNLLVREIRNKYKLSPGDWKIFCEQIKKEGLPLKTSYCRLGTGKYYYWDKNRGMFKVQRHIGDNTIFFGYYPTEDEAQARVEELHDCQWNGLLKE